MAETSSGLDKRLMSDEDSPGPAQTELAKKDVELVRRCLAAIEERAKKFSDKGMTKGNFVFGVANSLFVAWSFGATPGYFWIVYLLEVFTLLPVRWNRMVRATPKEHLYWLDFCWMANFGGVIVVFALYFTSLNYELQEWCFCAAWGLGNGPLLCATALLGNALLFHDFDNTAAVLIHLLPSLVMYEMGWNHVYVTNAWPDIFKYHFMSEIRPWEIYVNAATVYGIWFVLYTTWLLWCGMECPFNGYDTIFHYSMKGAPGKVMKKLLKVSDEDHKSYLSANRYPTSYALLYMTCHAISVLISIPVSLACYASRHIHVCLCAAMVLVTIYNASARYTYYMVHSYTDALKAELKIPQHRGFSAILDEPGSPAT